MPRHPVCRQLPDRRHVTRPALRSSPVPTSGWSSRADFVLLRHGQRRRSRRPAAAGPRLPGRLPAPQSPRQLPLSTQLLETHFETLKRLWEAYGRRFERRYGLWQGYWDSAVFSYLDCGLFESGFRPRRLFQSAALSFSSLSPVRAAGSAPPVEPSGLRFSPSCSKARFLRTSRTPNGFLRYGHNNEDAVPVGARATEPASERGS